MRRRISVITSSTWSALVFLLGLSWMHLSSAASFVSHGKNHRIPPVQELTVRRRTLSSPLVTSRVATATCRAGSTSPSTSCLHASFLKSNWTNQANWESSTNSTNNRSIRSIGRRDFWAGTWFTAVAVAAAVGTTTVRGTMPPLEKSKALAVSNGGSSSMSTTTTTSTNLATVADAVQWIDQNCDRRFLHAVLASENRFLYRGVDNDRVCVNQNVVSDLLLPETYSGYPGALPFFQQLETLLQEEAIQPSNGHLATTSIQDAAAWGTTAASIWPQMASYSSADKVHYAWFQDGGLFYPRPSSFVLDRNSIIVDGRDCGKDCLEDALRGESLEIMFSTSSFLAVPISQEAELREQLRNAFLV